MLGSVGHHVKFHKITPALGNELGDINIKEGGGEPTKVEEKDSQALQKLSESSS
jgi:hypothetical protein